MDFLLSSVGTSCSIWVPISGPIWDPILRGLNLLRYPIAWSHLFFQSLGILPSFLIDQARATESAAMFKSKPGGAKDKPDRPPRRTTTWSASSRSQFSFEQWLPFRLRRER